MFREGDQLGPYTLVSKIGSGAFGTVWLADRATQIATTRVALKLPLGSDVDVEAIRHEANTWVQASGHPNVVPIIEANIYDGQVVIASEYIAEGSLEDWLNANEGRAPSIEAAVDMTRGILAGLEHLHSRHIIHRDLKPANLLIQGETPRLADFGISRVLNTSSRTAMAAGTPSYMAPEAFDGKRTEQTDLWAVGVMLYQMLTGRLPFPQQDMTSLIGAIVARNPEPLPAFVPAPLQAVISCVLAKDAAQRYRSASEMRAAVRNAAKQLQQGGTQPAPQQFPPRPMAETLPQQQPFTNPGPVRPAPISQYPVAPTMPVAQSYPPHPQYPQPMYQPAPPKGRSPMVFVLIALIAVLVIGGGIFAFIKLRSDSPSPQPPPGPVANINTSPIDNRNISNTNRPPEPPASSNVYKFQDAGIQLETPIAWTRQKKGDRVQVTAPDQNVSIVFWIGNVYTIDEGVEILDAELERVMDEVEPEDEATPGTLNGMPANRQSGKGTTGGQAVEWSRYVVMGNKPLLLFIFANPNQYDQHLPDLDKLINSIQKMS